jgi:hypothetical protein
MQRQQQFKLQPANDNVDAPVDDDANNYDRTTQPQLQSQQRGQQQRKQYARKLPPSPTERAASIARQKRRLVYERMRSQSLEITNAPPSIWSFDSLFAAPVVDEEQVRQDLYGIRDRDCGVEEVKLRQLRLSDEEETTTMQQQRRKRGIDLIDLLSGSTTNNNGVDREVVAVTREEDVELTRQVIMNNNIVNSSNSRNNNNIYSVEDNDANIDAYVKSRNAYAINIINDEAVANVTVQSLVGDIVSDDDDSSSSSSTSVNPTPSNIISSTTTVASAISTPLTSTSSIPAVQAPVDKTLTRMVQDRLYGLSRTPGGSIQYSTSMLDTSRAVQFREGIRLGRALKINIDRLCHFAKKDVSHGRLEEGQEYYTKAQKLDPTDGRPYLGLSRIAQRRGDIKLARDLLKEGIHKSIGGYVVVKGPCTNAVVDGGSRSLMKKQQQQQRTERSNKTGSSSSSSNNRDEEQSDVNFQEEEGAVIGTIPDLGPNPHLMQALGTLEQECGNLALAEDLYLQAIRSRPSHAGKSFKRVCSCVCVCVVVLGYNPRYQTQTATLCDYRYDVWRLDHFIIIIIQIIHNLLSLLRIF